MEYFLLSWLFTLPAGIIIFVLIVAYLIYRRMQEKKKEDFEKRSN